MNDLIKGTLAGFIATAPMTFAMVAMYRLLPRRQQYRLPPRQVTMSILSASSSKRDLDESERTNATLVSHFAYGAACGALYAPVAGRLRPPAVVGGIAQGLAVWTVSYLGVLPALGILEPATRRPAERNVLMITAHVVWGAVVGSLVERMLQEDDHAARAGSDGSLESRHVLRHEPLSQVN